MARMYKMSGSQTMWLAVGNSQDGSKCVEYSYDGMTWTAVPTNILSGGNGESLVWNGSYWLLVGGGTYNSINTIAKSTDGINWTSCSTHAINERVYSVAWDGSKWIAGGVRQDRTTHLIKSTDGINWTPTTQQPFGGDACKVICYNGSYWLASDGNSKLAKSTDGDNWTLLTGANSPFNTGMTTSLVWNGTYWIAGGGYLLSGVNTGVNFAKSTDGITWTHSTSKLYMNAHTIVWNGTYWMATGNRQANLNVPPAISYDGLTWVLSTNSLFDNKGSRGSISWNGSEWLLSNFNSGITHFYMSTNGTNWNAANPDPFAGGQIFQLANTSVAVFTTAPGAPRGITVVAGTNSATVSWTAPASNGGSAITGYTVTPSVGSAVTVGNVLTATVSGLASGTGVTFTVVAINAAGSSPVSLVSPSVTPVEAATAPGAPTGITVVAGINSATVSWTAPSSNGGSVITGYTVSPSAGSAVTVGNVLTATVSGLASGTGVTFTVVAINAVGSSSVSPVSPSVTPAAPTAPGAPTGITVVAGTNSATVSWTAPASNGGSAITGYTVSPSLGSPVTVGNVLTATLTGLANGTNLTFTVVAINSVGGSSTSQTSPSVTPMGPPGAPTGITAVAGTNSAIVSWVAPVSNGGSAITGYTVTPSVGSAVTVGNVLTTTVSGLASGTGVTFTVVAINAVGGSATSPVSPSITPNSPTSGPPSAVLGVTGVAGNASATISWSPPISNGGSTITGYKVISDADRKRQYIAGPDARSLLVTGVKNGVRAIYTVVAVNAAGQSDSVALTSYPLPGSPTNIRAIRGASGVINLSWAARASHVSSPITGYVVSLVSPLPAPVGMVIPTPTVLSTGGSVSVSGLTNGASYVFSVKSVSSISQSRTSRFSKAVIVASRPDMPTSFSGVKGVVSASLSWLAPVNTNGFPITGYKISYIVSGLIKHLHVKAVNSAIIRGLANGTEYSFTIAAITLAGTSDPSSPITVTPGVGL
jgi:hypothetical protein